MIKATATLNGVISKQATMRQTQDGKSQIVFSVKVTIPGARNNMQGMETFVSVAKFGSEAELAQYAAGARIEANGTLTFRKSGDNLYLNFFADRITLNPESSKSGIEGTLDFKGTIGNTVDVKTDKNGHNYVAFSAFSTEKVREEFEFTWVRFVKFNYEKEEFLQTKAKIQAKGKLTITVYNGRMTLDCMMDEVKHWERTQTTGTDNKEDLPF
jgi:hypothetical protein